MTFENSLSATQYKHRDFSCLGTRNRSSLPAIQVILCIVRILSLFDLVDSLSFGGEDVTKTWKYNITGVLEIGKDCVVRLCDADAANSLKSSIREEVNKEQWQT